MNKLKQINFYINPIKTDAITFLNKKTPDKQPKLHEQTIKTKRLLNYLGMKLQSHLSFIAHIQNTNSQDYILPTKKLCTPGLSLRPKLLIYKVILRPSILHGASYITTLILHATLTLPIPHSPEEITTVSDQYIHEDM